LLLPEQVEPLHLHLPNILQLDLEAYLEEKIEGPNSEASSSTYPAAAGSMAGQVLQLTLLTSKHGIVSLAKSTTSERTRG
jgi:hypothetical protein